MFKVKGATVYPIEVESALRATPGVSYAFVTNVTHSDGHEQVGALVVSADEPRDIADGVRTRLSAFKVPSVWLVVTDPSVAPMSATGKIDKASLQALLADRGSSIVRAQNFSA
jgi:acyl-CoA synthetase (AMP-forming)/AMP-acid ligase II